MIGQTIGSFQILAKLGEGGMGEVYRARDLTLGRTVALKVLRPSIAQDRDGRQRFEREAQLLASFNHPNVAQIYGVAEGTLPGSTASVRALVLELVDGETLDGRITASGRSGLPVKEALEIARQIATALDAAHARGIVHRDLKPANVKVSATDVVKVLDFGLAKIVLDEPPTDAADGMTRTEATREGAVVGTAAYMSPEQARGLAVDKRTDVWAFGCVLYEMLTSRRAFQGPTTTDTLVTVLEREPDWTLLPAGMPPGIRQLLQRCLQKDPARRLRDIGDVGILIDDALGDQEQSAGAAVHERRRARRREPAIVLIVTAVLIAAAAILYFLQPTPAGTETIRLSVSPRVQVVPQLSAALSPDGRQIAFVAADAQGRSVLWVRALDALDGRELAGTENAIHPFWSPDSKSLGFVANDKLKRIDLAGGNIQTLADTNRGGGSWSREDIIIFTKGFRSGLWTVPATGGTPSQVTTPDEAFGEITHGWPQFLPDGRQFIYFSQNSHPERRGVYAQVLGETGRRHLLQTDFRALYAPPDYLLFVQDEALMAQSFDARHLTLGGQPSQVEEGIWVAAGAGQAAFSVSETGVLAHVNATMWNTQLAWFDRTGQPIGAVGPPDRYAAHTPDLSPDGKRVAIARGPWSREDIWILDATTGAGTRMTFGPVANVNPVWSSDGHQLLFRSSGAGARLALMRADGSGSPEMLFEGLPTGVRSVDWSAAARAIVYSVGAAGGNPDLWWMGLDADKRPRPFLETPGVEYQPQLSPDGRWVAYVSNESGREEVYVQRFPDAGSKRQISYTGANQPRWRGDGRELYFVSLDSRMMTVPVSAAGVVDAKAPVMLFPSRIPVSGFGAAGVGALYDVTPDGQRFLINMTTTELGPPITVITNWPGALKLK